jgi:hypothetical protein
MVTLPYWTAVVEILAGATQSLVAFLAIVRGLLLLPLLTHLTQGRLRTLTPFLRVNVEVGLNTTHKRKMSKRKKIWTRKFTRFTFS